MASTPEAREICMQATDRQSRYYAYVLRLWEQQGNDHMGDWRCSLEDPHTGSRRGFAGLAALIAFLQEELMRPHMTIVSAEEATIPEHSPSNDDLLTTP